MNRFLYALCLLCLLAPAVAAAQDGPRVTTEDAGLDDSSLTENELAKLRIRAENGHVLSQYRLGRLYKDGDRGVDKDPEKAFRWYLAAARGGNLEAQRTVASMYYEGFGIRKAPAHAFKWYRTAAERGDFHAIKAVGDMYYRGIGTGQDFEAAFRWLRKAAENGDPGSQLRIGRMYRDGKGTRQSDFQAYLWLNLASLTVPGEERAEVVAERDAIEAEMSESERLGAKLVSEEYARMYTDLPPGEADQ
jgi:TPR repeat protein